eukprot:11010495-Alexandrium_andersonii.AAC.1
MSRLEQSPAQDCARGLRADGAGRDLGDRLEGVTSAVARRRVTPFCAGQREAMARPSRRLIAASL